LAKKKEKIEESNIKGILKQMLLPNLKNILSSYFSDMLHKTQETIYETEKKLEKNMLIVAVFILGLIFAFIGITFLVEEYSNLSKGSSFFLIGFILVFISMIFMLLDKNKR
jgi:magnesium-transporting ATPase (P-type)